MFPKIPTVITFVSIIPFILISVLLSFDFIEKPTYLLNLLITYATILLSFLAGTRWGMAIDHHDVHNKLANNLYLLSTAMVLFAWMILLIGDPLTQLLALTLLFTLAWGVDSFLYSNRVIPLWFFTIRSMVTPIVIVSLYVSYFSIL